MLEFKFKQDKIKLTYISSNNGVMDLIVKHSRHIKSNGKLRKSVIKYNTNVMNGLNVLLATIVAELKKEKATEEDW